ncbi:hypothetical protein JQ599_31960 [Bradyrhizobium diazoefficiens]|nr:hypothetical protein [Bradyrhizobium diazoefficiens]MBR0704558.1 hypothetical protein [Bradyrhizobium diazoefficiens]MBR0773126.1 hypothetical protein [Bradyrhizobium diazoefficiens]
MISRWSCPTLLNNPAGDDKNRIFRDFFGIIFLQEVAATEGLLSLWPEKIENAPYGEGKFSLTAQKLNDGLHLEFSVTLNCGARIGPSSHPSKACKRPDQYRPAARVMEMDYKMGRTLIDSLYRALNQALVERITRGTGAVARS